MSSRKVKPVVVVSMADIKKGVLGEVYRLIRALDLNSLRKAVATAKPATVRKEEPWLSVAASLRRAEASEPGQAGMTVLVFIVDCHGMFNVFVEVEPKDFNRDDAKDEEVYQKCCAIVDIMQTAAKTDENADEHASVFPFEFWNMEDDVLSWDRLAEIWLNATN